MWAMMEKLRIRSAQYSSGGGTPAFFALAAADVAAADVDVEPAVTLVLSAAPPPDVDMCNLVLVVEAEVVDKVRLLVWLGTDGTTPHAAAVGNCRRRSVTVVVKTETAKNRTFRAVLDILVSTVCRMDPSSDDGGGIEMQRG
jgi:hypothetical protein